MDNMVFYDGLGNNKFERLGIPVPENENECFEISEEDRYVIFRNDFMVSKADVLLCIKNLMKNKNLMSNFSDGKGTAITGILNDLYTQVDYSELFDAPEGYWHYEIEVDVLGARIKLVGSRGHVKSDGYYIIDEEGDEYIMFSSDSKLLSAVEFAKMYNVDADTIRIWIRRGKIRDAIRLGGEWFIPELVPTSFTERGFTSAKYSWSQPFELNVQGFENFSNYLSKYNVLVISKANSNDERLFRFWFSHENDKNFDKNKIGTEEKFILKKSEAEKLEALFIGHPLVMNKNKLRFSYEYSDRV